jgi:5'-3' exonuclease
VSELVLIDLSSIAHPIWHMSQGDPDPNHTSVQTVAKVRALATGQPHVAVCCDSGRSFRAEIDSTYKANRPESDATLQHQITVARETLVGDGFPVWAVKGFEADDLIAAGTRLGLEAGMSVLVVSSDKDLLQLVGPNVKAKSLKNGEVVDTEGVVAKFGVKPEQMRDYLTLVGDASDNVKGANGIGPKKAAALLAKHASLDDLYADLRELGPQDLGLKPSEAASLAEFEARYPTVRSLIALRDDVQIPFSEVMTDRTPKEAATFAAFAEEGETMEAEPVPETAPAQQPATVPAQTAPVALAVRDVEILPPAPEQWERQLDPRSMTQARTLSKDLFDSRMFSAYGTPQGVLSTVMVGRELGLPAMAALRSIHVVEGRHSLSSALMVALVLKSGFAEYFEPVSFSETEATFETKRKGARKEVRLTHTIEMARTAGLVKEKSNWLKVPTDMLMARAQSRLARLVYPDLLAGLYTPDELAEMRDV